MDVQGLFLAKVILHRDMRHVVNARISAEYFTDDTYKRVFGYMLKHWSDYGVSPDLAVMTRAFPSMTWDDDDSQPLDYYINALQQRRKFSILTDGLTEAAKYFHDADNPDATDLMEEALQVVLQKAHLAANRTYDIDLPSKEYSDEVAKVLDQRMLNPGHLRGISTGFDGIDWVTGGLEPENFVVLMGVPKSFKSATALAIALRIWQNGHVPLFIGFEMSNTEQTDRLLSLISKVSLTKIMMGSLGEKENPRGLTLRRKIDNAYKRMMEADRPFFLSADITSGMTVSGIQAKIQELQPDVVIIDGAYMMQSEDSQFAPGSAQAITSISRGLKRLAQAAKIPIVVTTQASQTRSKGGLHMGSAMYSQSWAQDCDILLGVERVSLDRSEEDASGPVRVKLRVIESRSGPRKDVVLEWDWNEGQVIELDPEKQARLLRQRPQSLDEDDDEYD